MCCCFKGGGGLDKKSEEDLTSSPAGIFYQLTGWRKSNKFLADKTFFLNSVAACKERYMAAKNAL